MNTWMRALREGWFTGSVASVASTAVLAALGRREIGHAAAPVNAVSHWVWDRESLRADGATARHTLTGYLVHHGASVFWATLYARAWGWRDEAKRPLPALAGAAVASAVACCVDFKATPERLTPGFEHRLSLRSLALVYASFALGLAAANVALGARREAQKRIRPR